VPDRRYCRERLPACGFHHLSKLEFAKNCRMTRYSKALQNCLVIVVIEDEL